MAPSIALTLVMQIHKKQSEQGSKFIPVDMMLLLACVLALLHCAASAPKTAVKVPVKSGCANNTTKTQFAADEDEAPTRIIGGKDAEPGQFPWAAALFYRDRFICTSSIISERTVMTAAHCVVDDRNRPRSPDTYYALANVNKSAPSLRLNFQQLFVHPGYPGMGVDDDIALFKTAEPIAFSDEVQPVCVAAPDTPMEAYNNATAMGWGNTSPIRAIRILPDLLQFVEQSIVPNLACPLLGAPGVDNNKVCATGFFNGVCNGDSGGPLVHLSADKPPVEIGITSYGNAAAGCGKISPGVFTRISSYYDFIAQHTAGETVCTV